MLTYGDSRCLVRVAKPIDGPDRFDPGRKGLYTPCPRDVRSGPAV